MQWRKNLRILLSAWRYTPLVLFGQEHLVFEKVVTKVNYAAAYVKINLENSPVPLPFDGECSNARRLAGYWAKWKILILLSFLPSTFQTFRKQELAAQLDRNFAAKIKKIIIIKLIGNDNMLGCMSAPRSEQIFKNIAKTFISIHG